jgi:hypothetical protein
MDPSKNQFFKIDTQYELNMLSQGPPLPQTRRPNLVITNPAEEDNKAQIVEELQFRFIDLE